MQVSDFSIEHLARLLNGDTQHLPYLSGPQLVEFFNRFGSRDQYGQGFPSRWAYVADKLANANGTPLMVTLIENFFDPRSFFDSEFDRTLAIEKANELLQYDGYKIVLRGHAARIITTDAGEVVPDSLARVEDDFVQGQIEKCDEKLQIGDFDGAITNARTLVETVIVDILSEYDQEYQHKGDLNAAYKRLKGVLRLNPATKEYPESIKQVLSGLNSIVQGLSTIRNEMSDAHRRRYKPNRHHARLAVNTAKTLADFLLDSLKKQYGNDGESRSAAT